MRRMSDYISKLTPEQAREVPMVDMAFEVLKAANTPFYYRDLMAEIAKAKGFTDEEVMQVIAQLYTEINVDGRFACVGNNLWGLKRWYPVDNKEGGEMGSSKRPRIINDDDDDLDEEEYLDEEEDTFAEEGDEFDAFDEDREDIGGDEEEDLFAPEDVEEEIEETEELEELDEELGEEGEEESEFEDDLSEDADEDDDK